MVDRGAMGKPRAAQPRRMEFVLIRAALGPYPRGRGDHAPWPAWQPGPFGSLLVRSGGMKNYGAKRSLKNALSRPPNVTQLTMACSGNPSRLGVAQ